MQPSRILPDLQCALLCEEVRQEMSGNFILIGVLGYVRVPQVPVTAFRIFSFTRWTAGVGQFTEVVRVVAPDGQTVLRQSQTKFALQDPAHNTTNVTVFAQVEFKTAGVYAVEVSVDDVMKIRYPLPVLVVPPPGAGSQGPGPAPTESGAGPAPGASA